MGMNKKEGKTELMKGFKMFDDDNTSKISIKNLSRVAKELGETCSEAELNEILKECDEDGDGEIGESNFLNVMVTTGMLGAESEQRVGLRSDSSPQRDHKLAAHALSSVSRDGWTRWFAKIKKVLEKKKKKKKKKKK